MEQIRQEQALTINGRQSPYVAQSVRDLLAGCGLDPDQPGIAVAINAAVVPRAEWASTALVPGDRIEIVHARAGG